MPLQPGTRLGPYEVTAAIGAGGMGEVYQARDTALNRDVAIKVLPEAVAGDADRLARFQREAEALAALNHPNIAQVYGLERSGDTPAIVMELVEGPTLADRISQGAIPLDEALPIARQIAEALEAAHERGIIHRDLKPANVKVKNDGTVKVLDFGLAKAMEPASAADASAGQAAANSPTLTARATQMGMILGTAAYMAPEQAKGKHVDKRADAWAFGVVLFEMLTGQRPFDGSDVSEVMARVIDREPDWNALPAATPRSIHRLLRRCLVKTRNDRLPDIIDARLEIDEAVAEPDEPSIGSPGGDRAAVWRRALPLVVGGVVVGLGLGAGLWSPWRTVDRQTSPALLPLGLAEPLRLRSGASVSQDLTISPDGRVVIYSGQGPSAPRLLTRPLGELFAAPLRGADPGRNPVVSPDNWWVAFTGPEGSCLSLSCWTSLRKVPLAGGPPTPLAELPSFIVGMTWIGTDEIVVGTYSDGLFRVPAAGGDPEPLTTVPAGSGEHHMWPFYIRDANAVLFAAAFESGEAGPLIGPLEAVDLDTGVRTPLGVSGTSPRYVATGHLLYAGADGTFLGVRFDVDDFAMAGAAFPLFDGLVARGEGGAANFAVSAGGHLVYAPEVRESWLRDLTWVDRDGNEELIEVAPTGYEYARVSPDGTRLALDVRDPVNEVWILDLVRRIPSVITTDPSAYAEWLDPDRVVLEALNDGKRELRVQAANGTGTPQLVAEFENAAQPNAVLPENGGVIIRSLNSAGGGLVFVRMDGTTKTVLSDDRAQNATLSPNAHWMAYESNRSGRWEVYVRPFPDVESDQWQVSAIGGRKPVWSSTGTELFYMQRDHMMMVPVGAGPGFDYGSAVELFDLTPYYTDNNGRNYDVVDDRFIMIKRPTVWLEVFVFLNWFDELRARDPVR